MKVTTTTPLGDKYDAIIYDLDGTLLDTETASSEVLQSILTPFNKTFTLELKLHILGTATSYWAPYILNHFDITALSPTELVEKWQAGLKERYSSLTALPGALEVIKTIESTFPRITQAIATSSNSEAVAAKRDAHPAIFEAMSLIVCGDQVQNGKPDPEIFLKTAETLKVPPARCLVLEDSLNGVLAAKAAGMNVIAIPVESNNEFMTHANVVLTSMEHFFTVFQ